MVQPVVPAISLPRRSPLLVEVPAVPVISLPRRNLLPVALPAALAKNSKL